MIREYTGTQNNGLIKKRILSESGSMWISDFSESMRMELKSGTKEPVVIVDTSGAISLERKEQLEYITSVSGNLSVLDKIGSKFKQILLLSGKYDIYKKDRYFILIEE